MMTCQSCQGQLLEYVYGLFDLHDSAEAGTLTELRAHLETCAACQSACERARQQQLLLGQASRVKTSLTFAAPKVEIQRSRFVHQRATFIAWYVSAACVVFALLLGAGGAYWWGTATKWKNVETAQAEMTRLRQMPGEAQDVIVRLKLQINAEEEAIAQLSKAVKKLEAETERHLAASTTYQQILAPGSVTANNDAPIVVWSSTLSGQPANLPEVDNNLRDSLSRKAISQQNRRNEKFSNKLNFDISSVAYANTPNKSLLNEVVQDIGGKNALAKVIHPLQVLPSRYAAHLCTDKPIYQPGEEVFFRALALEKTTFQAPTEELHYTFKLTGPDDQLLKRWSKTAQLIDPRTHQPLKDVRGHVIQGIGGESFTLPANMPLGECLLTLTEKNDRCDEQAIKFMVNKLPAPRFDKQLQFNRASYTPGDEVVVSGKIRLPSQQPWVHGAIRGQIVIDGELYDVQGQKTAVDIQSSTDASGNVKLAFRLPTSVESGQGTLTLQLQSQDGIDIWSHPLRIEKGMLNVDCYPEGGDLIAGVPNHVYFQMRNKFGEAVEGEAELVDGHEKVIETLETFHDESEARASRGMGSFQFTPQANQSYHIRMKKPATAQVALRLPAAKASGVALHIDQPILQAGASLPITLSNAGQSRQLAVSVHCRGVLIALDQLSMAASTQQQMVLPLNKPVGGVFRVTVSEIVTQHGSTQLVPLAERLFYRHPDRTLNLSLKTEPVVGKTVKLHIDSKTEANQPSPAYLTIAGVNKSLIQMAEATTTRRLPAHFLIAQEVRQPEELEFADFFLASHHSASRALDLLLGVQGWRRFKETDDVAALQQLGQNQTDKLPIYCYTNREETLNQVQLQARELTNQSKEGKQLQEVKTRLSDLQTQLRQQSTRQTEATASRQREIVDAEKSYQANLAEWQRFSIWFHLGCAGILGAMSLVGLVAIALRRAFLPTHLIWTVGMLSLLGIAGALFLSTRQPVDQQMPVGNQLKDLSKLNGDASAPAANQPSAPMGDDKQQAGAAGAQPPLSVDEKNRAYSKGDREPQFRADKAAVEKSDNPDVRLKRNQDTESLKPAGQATEGAARKMDMAPSVPPATATPPGKLAIRSGNFTNKDYQAKESKDQVSQQAYQRMTKLPDNRMMLRQEPAAPAKAKTSEAPGTESAQKKLETAKSGAFGGGGGGGGRAGMDNSGKILTSPQGSQPTPEFRKSADARESLEESVKETTAFFVREYAWKSDTRPAGISASTATWSKTIYWHPMQVVPSSGKLDLTIELPSQDGAYQFEVFGHDGEGRLGASSIELKVAPTPVSLQLKLSGTEAKVGDLVRLECLVQNQSSRRQPQVIAKIQLPDGLSLSPNFRQIRNAVKAANSNEPLEPTKWWVQERELTLICAELDAQQKVKLEIDLICSKPGSFTGAPSRAYLENQEQDATIVPGLVIRIRPG